MRVSGVPFPPRLVVIRWLLVTTVKGGRTRASAPTPTTVGPWPVGAPAGSPAAQPSAGRMSTVEMVACRRHDGTILFFIGRGVFVSRCAGF